MSTQMLAIVKDGKIQTLDSIDLPEGTELFVTIDRDLEAVDWSSLSLNGLSRAYADDEPEYEISQLKELNPTYEGR
jgi:hypothetical protein